MRSRISVCNILTRIKKTGENLRLKLVKTGKLITRLIIEKEKNHDTPSQAYTSTQTSLQAFQKAFNATWRKAIGSGWTCCAWIYAFGEESQEAGKNAFGSIC